MRNVDCWPRPSTQYQFTLLLLANFIHRNHMKTLNRSEDLENVKKKTLSQFLALQNLRHKRKMKT